VVFFLSLLLYLPYHWLFPSAFIFPQSLLLFSASISRTMPWKHSLCLMCLTLPLPYDRMAALDVFFSTNLVCFLPFFSFRFPTCYFSLSYARASFELRGLPRAFAGPRCQLGSSLIFLFPSPSPPRGELFFRSLVGYSSTAHAFFQSLPLLQGGCPFLRYLPVFFSCSFFQESSFVRVAKRLILIRIPYRGCPLSPPPGSPLFFF